MKPNNTQESQGSEFFNKKDIQKELDDLLDIYIRKIKSGHVGWGISFVAWLELNNHYKLVGYKKFKKIEVDFNFNN